jgi:hypothetical protein
MTLFQIRRHWLLVIEAVAIVYLLLAYVVLPLLWTHYEHEPGLASLPMVTHTGSGIPGDALNVGLVGKDAPVSPLYFEGKKEQLAFEKPDGGSADRRHHVRLWIALENGTDGRPVWLGAATYDRGVGLSRYTGQVTHHIGPDIDAERDLLMRDLRDAGMADALFQISGIGPTLFGRNGGGDPYYTDGEIDIASLVVNGVKRTTQPATLPPPPLVALKDQIWHGVSGAMPP